MTELLPCPFCGASCSIRVNFPYNGAEKWFVECLGCKCRTDKHSTKIEAINSWNKSYKRIKKMQNEETCTMTKIQPPKILEGWWECSNCGPVFPPCNLDIAKWALEYCPHCGAKVVDQNGI